MTKAIHLAGLPEVDSLDPGYQEDPHRFHRQARQLSPVAMGPFGPVALSYDAVRTVLRHRRFRRPKDLGLQAQGITSGPLWERAATGLLSLDGEDHHRLRRLISPAFTPACAAKLRSTMIEVINWLTEPVIGTGNCDIVADIARPYPIPVICELLGAPSQDWGLFSAWTDEISKMFSNNVTDNAPGIVQAMDELGAYLDELAARRRHTLTDDLISNLIRTEDTGGRLTHDELIMLAGTALTAGIDTTRNQLAAAVDVLCDHPGQSALLAARPELAPLAVCEVMRHSPIILGTHRTAVEDVDLAGVLIPAGTLIFACTAAANRDPSIYHDPDRFNITREAPEPMLTFGGGIHHCLGAHLAKAELAIALTTLATRMPNMRRTGPAPWKPVLSISGPITLPVQFDRR
jgi:cytochrome P450